MVDKADVRSHVPADRPALQCGEIDVTGAMVAAGLDALFPDADFRPSAVEEEVIARVYRAMLKARSDQ